MSVAGKAGYKETAVGWIPVEWDCERLANLTRSFAGGTPDRSKPDYFNGAIPWVKSGEVNSRKVTTTEEHISESALAASSAKMVESGAVLVAMYGATAGKIARLLVDAATNQAVLSIRSSTSARLDNGYLFWVLETNAEKLLAMCQGAAQPNLSKGLIDGLAIAIPPLPEQQKIAAILTAVDDKLDLIARQISATQTLKQGLMQTLFTRGAGTPDAQGRWHPHTEFQDTELGRIPVGWSAAKLDSHVSKVGSGVTPKGGSDSYLPSGVPLIRSQNVLVGSLSLDDVAFISEAQHEKMRNSALEPEDVLLNITGASIGRCAILPANFGQGNVNQHVCIIRTSASLNPYYLCQFLNSALGQIQVERFQAGGNREGLNYQQIRSFDLPLPSVGEQKKIAEILLGFDDKLTTLTTKQTHYQSLKRGLMQKLLTGEWRVRVESSTGIA